MSLCYDHYDGPGVLDTFLNFKERLFYPSHLSGITYESQHYARALFPSHLIQKIGGLPLHS
jgi:hypothetical protein